MLEILLKNLQPEVEIESLEFKSYSEYKALIRCKIMGSDYAEGVKSFMEKLSAETCTKCTKIIITITTLTRMHRKGAVPIFGTGRRAVMHKLT